MKLLQRYILGELVRVFLLLVIVLTLMLVFVGVFREATQRGLGPVQILQILPYVVPSMLPFTVPATLLLSVCVVYGGSPVTWKSLPQSLPESVRCNC